MVPKGTARVRVIVRPASARPTAMLGLQRSRKLPQHSQAQLSERAGPSFLVWSRGERKQPCCHCGAAWRKFFFKVQWHVQVCSSINCFLVERETGRREEE